MRECGNDGGDCSNSGCDIGHATSSTADVMSMEVSNGMSVVEIGLKKSVVVEPCTITVVTPASIVEVTYAAFPSIKVAVMVPTIISMTAHCMTMVHFVAAIHLVMTIHLVTAIHFVTTVHFDATSTYMHLAGCRSGASTQVTLSICIGCEHCHEAKHHCCEKSIACHSLIF